MFIPWTSIYLLIILTLGEAEGHPIFSGWLRKVSAASGGDAGWIWGWAWGADSTVAVVDRSPPVIFESRPASFGAMLDDPLLGYVIPMSSFTVPCVNTTDDEEVRISEKNNLGCPRLCVVGPHEPERTESWIALVQRGTCQFVLKVREAQRFGAKAVVVGGDDPATSGNADTLVNMYSPGDSSDIKIPATFIRFSDYKQLSHLIETSNTSTWGIKTLSLQISAEYASWEWYSPILTFLVLLFIPSSLTFVTILIHRVRAVRAARRDRAPEDIVNSLPWCVWTGSRWEKHEGAVPVAQENNETPSSENDLMPDLERGENANDAVGTDSAPSYHGDPSTSNGKHGWFDEQTECAICLSDFAKGDRVRVLPCQHIFHLDEVDAWLIQRKKLCPVCKADVTQPHPPSDGPPPTTLVPTEETPLLSNDSPHDAPHA
ncbi:hypothetical protein BD410DRAFT_794045 [Rickenella mellea]|uniref:RING-type E3 ubiquitin transferase n=1 Tax=Rickenella mellea TaxID=50990 RepID=A0A4Y7PT64_9AGAM|nr:hypothetical protein BD410DRAFT_794045 [Rickenella mellea]